MEGEIDEYFRLKILFSSPWYLLHDSDGNDLSSSLNRAIKLSNAPALSLAAYYRQYGGKYQCNTTSILL